MTWLLAARKHSGSNRELEGLGLIRRLLVQIPKQLGISIRAQIFLCAIKINIFPVFKHPKNVDIFETRFEYKVSTFCRGSFSRTVNFFCGDIYKKLQ